MRESRTPPSGIEILTLQTFILYGPEMSLAPGEVPSLFAPRKVLTVEAELEPLAICFHFRGESQKQGDKLRKFHTPCILSIFNLSRML